MPSLLTQSGSVKRFLGEFLGRWFIGKTSFAIGVAFALLFANNKSALTNIAEMNFVLYKTERKTIEKMLQKTLHCLNNNFLQSQTPPYITQRGVDFIC